MAKKAKLSREGFERLVEKVLVTLPEEFQGYLENVAVIIENDPPDDMRDVMGRYEGVPLVERSMDDMVMPVCITLYMRPIERACHTRAEMGVEVRVTVLHEIGHFFGLEEGQLEHLESKKDTEIRGPEENKRYHPREHQYY
ncbi:MAG: metallopeptidase family protein [Chloroflexi bacterium]|nr:metallopeptidase family protein [Chloroflexota bacterium]